MVKRALSLLSIAICMICFTYVDVSATAPMPNVSAHHAVVAEKKSGRIIAGYRENERASMASTTKIMTALLLCENRNLDDTAVVTKEMVSVEGSSMGLLPNDTVHYRDLLYGMMLASGNDAANATAMLIAGSVESFAAMMNARAKEIGMINTNFVTPSGLDDENHYSTAYDMALLACEALKNPDLAKAVSSRSAQLEYGNPPYKRTLTNHNKLLAYYAGCDGVKTGFTKKSGRCLVSSASRDGKGVIVVTLNDPNDWSDHQRLLDYGLQQLETRELPLPELPNATVLGGVSDEIGFATERVTLSLLPEDFSRVSCDVELSPSVFAPVEVGEPIGSAVYRLDNVELARVDITAVDSVAVNDKVTDKNYLYWICRLLGSK